MSIKLFDYQLDALYRLKTGSILCGGVGSGKSITALGYYYLVNGGSPDFLNGGRYYIMDDLIIKNLYIITTAHKRDTKEWDLELSNFLMAPDNSLYQHEVVVDSWNNIKKYVDIRNAFFIFDEQRVVGKGEWVKSFLKIAKNNDWILLSATPGDTWSDYIPVFIANGFYRNRSEFLDEHVIYNPFLPYSKVDRYINVKRLNRLRDKILVNMEFERSTVSHYEDISCNYDSIAYRTIMKERWDIFANKPIKQAATLCSVLRRIVNSDSSRANALLDIFEKKKRVIVFYNYDYERDIIMQLDYGDDVEIAEWSGHKHQPVPESNKWVYLVQYIAGNDAWNCIKTDTIVFYSLNYSYKIMHQAAGRINRMNTPFKDLYYYRFISKSSIDVGIIKTIEQKKKFNESKFAKGMF